MKLALWQTHPRSNIDSALDALTDAAQKAAAQGADALVTPEMFVGGYNIGAKKIIAHAEQSAHVIDRLTSIARMHCLALVVGLALPGNLRPYNACVALDLTGKEIGSYHKTHLYGDVDRAQFEAGTALSQALDLNGWKVGLSICYDVEFPEVTRSLALQGAEIILCPTANMTPFDSVATRLVPARAEENAIFLAYCNYIGAEGEFAYNGLSCIAGPDGNDLSRSAHSEEILLASLDRMALNAAREVQTHLNDRRSDLYGDLG